MDRVMEAAMAQSGIVVCGLIKSSAQRGPASTRPRDTGAAEVSDERRCQLDRPSETIIGGPNDAPCRHQSSIIPSR